jgi:hypothetical protein
MPLSVFYQRPLLEELSSSYRDRLCDLQSTGREVTASNLLNEVVTQSVSMHGPTEIREGYLKAVICSLTIVPIIMRAQRSNSRILGTVIKLFPRRIV